VDPDPSTPIRRLLRRALEQALGQGARWKARLRVLIGDREEKLNMANDLTSASEALVAMPLPEMLKGLGLAVVEANKAMSEIKGPNATVMTINEATIDLNVAISVAKTEQVGASGGLALQAFNVNASYARTFNFKEEASSRISIKMAVVKA
jgi:hypothetical protein